MVLVSAESCTVAGPVVVRSSAPSDLVTLTTGILTSVVSPRVPRHLLLDDVVRHDDRHGAALRGGAFLLGERAGATVHQHDRAIDRQVVVVGGIAAGACVGRHGDQRTGHPDRRGGGAVLQRTRVELLAGNGHRSRFGVKHVRVELHGLHVKTLVPQLTHDVVDAGVVAGSADRAGVAVGIGDVLQLGQVGHHRVGADPPAQGGREVRTRSRRHRIGGVGGRASAGRQQQSRDGGQDRF